jgi:hypothetical protein
MDNVTIKKQVYGANKYNKVIDTSFSQLIKPQNIEVQPPLDDQILNFFKTYNDLFYNIPKEGNNSHQYLIQNSTEYTGYVAQSDTINALLEEINQLKQDLLKAETTIASYK